MTGSEMSTPDIIGVVLGSLAGAVVLVVVGIGLVLVTRRERHTTLLGKVLPPGVGPLTTLVCRPPQSQQNKEYGSPQLLQELHCDVFPDATTSLCHAVAYTQLVTDVQGSTNLWETLSTGVIY
jgi:hypothetical protein